MATSPPRGGALLNVLIVVSVLSVIGLAFLQKGSNDSDASAAQREDHTKQTVKAGAHSTAAADLRIAMRSSGRITPFGLATTSLPLLMTSRTQWPPPIA